MTSDSQKKRREKGAGVDREEERELAPGRFAFTPSAVDRIIDRAGGLPNPKRRTELTEQLEGVWFGYAVEELSKKVPPSKVAGRFKQIAADAGRLLKKLHSDGEKDIRDAPDHLWQLLEAMADQRVIADRRTEAEGGRIDFRLQRWIGDDFQDHKNYRTDLKLLALIEGIGLLQEFAREISQRAEDAKTSSRSRHRGKKARQVTILRLAALYEQFFGRSFGISKIAPEHEKYKGREYGPGVRFVRAFFKEIGEPISVEQVATAWNTRPAPR